MATGLLAVTIFFGITRLYGLTFVTTGQLPLRIFAMLSWSIVLGAYVGGVPTGWYYNRQLRAVLK